jgi:ubiquinone/menaquinone biosynthesis C-methylase UbiE
MVFVDVGSGTGFFTRAAAEIVGRSGHVYAVDMSAEMLAFMHAHGIPLNVAPTHSAEYAIPLDDAVADMAFLAFVAHETPDLERFLREVRRIVKPGGRIAIVDWKKQQEEQGPAMEERLDRPDLEAAATRVFRTVFSGELNDSHYYVIGE